MILNNAPQNEAVVSNVGEIGEFRIRNSAKAFNILSSGLYANKIKAVIRELSCNALDSHVAAGNNKPIDVHIPTYLEPYFSVRDYGTGLDHDQVTNIYTTYFESTKTNSNSFIGALGLGSKSPFSYTENFTVTAIKDGTKRIYTAFINDQGVPSIALMDTEQTDEHNGVEIRFAVENQNDFHKFDNEANNVFRWFKEQPNFTGKSVNVTKPEYETENLIPGVHVRKGGSYNPIAIMGNIAYPVEIPQADKVLGELKALLPCGLVMEFGIGELDFQASREGLSYIPQTIEAIKNKLKLVNERLSVFVAEEADKIENEWEKALFLSGKKRTPLFSAAVQEYVAKTGFALMNANSYYSSHYFEIKAEDFAELNIQLRAFSCAPHYNAMATEKPSRIIAGRDADGSAIIKEQWSISLANNTHFIENDTKVGALERSKHHYRTENPKPSAKVYVIEPIDKTKPVKLDEFYKLLHNPPEAQRKKASDLRQKDRAQSTGGLGKNVTILEMQERGGPRWAAKSKDLVWRDAGKSDEFSSGQNHYYIPLSGFNPQWKILSNYSTVAHLVTLIRGSGLPELKDVRVLGVRKGDIEDIKKKSNWINLETHVQDVFNKLGDKVTLGCVLEKLAFSSILKYNLEEIANNVHVGLAHDVLKDFIGVPKSNNYHSVRSLAETFSPNYRMHLQQMVEDYTKKFVEIQQRYPLIEKLDYSCKEEEVIHYINLIDKV